MRVERCKEFLAFMEWLPDEHFLPDGDNSPPAMLRDEVLSAGSAWWAAAFAHWHSSSELSDCEEPWTMHHKFIALATGDDRVWWWRNRNPFSMQAFTSGLCWLDLTRTDGFEILEAGSRKEVCERLARLICTWEWREEHGVVPALNQPEASDEGEEE